MNPTENSSPASPSAPQGVKPHRLIKLGVDVHLREYVVARQIDGTAPQPAQRFTPEAFVAWAAKQVQQADVVHCCYEAGPFGFGLHRRLLRFGVKNLVVRPRNWDEYGKKVKNFGDQNGPEVFGEVTLTDALVHSINAVFCEIGMAMGPKTILSYAKRFGFYSTPPLETPASERG